MMLLLVLSDISFIPIDQHRKQGVGGGWKRGVEGRKDMDIPQISELKFLWRYQTSNYPLFVLKLDKNRGYTQV